jgi:hypothetical protein
MISLLGISRVAKSEEISTTLNSISKKVTFFAWLENLIQSPLFALSACRSDTLLNSFFTGFSFS